MALNGENDYNLTSGEIQRRAGEKWACWMGRVTGRCCGVQGVSWGMPGDQASPHGCLQHPLARCFGIFFGMWGFTDTDPHPPVAVPCPRPLHLLLERDLLPRSNFGASATIFNDIPGMARNGVLSLKGDDNLVTRSAR